MARRTEEVNLKGKVKFCRHIQPDKGFEPYKWSVDLYPDEESINTIKELKKRGMQNHLKMDDDGQFMKFSRKTEETWKGVRQAQLPPRVITPTGEPIEVQVGDGSDVIIELDIYSHKTSVPGQTKIAARWKGMRVDNLVQYVPDDKLLEETKSLREEPAQLF